MRFFFLMSSTTAQLQLSEKSDLATTRRQPDTNVKRYQSSHELMSMRTAILLLLSAVSVFAAEPSPTVPFSMLPVTPAPAATAPPTTAPVATVPAATVVSAFHPEPALPRDVLTNEGIVALADAGYSPAFIQQRIRLSSRKHFDLTVDGLTYLRRNGVPEDLVEFMLDPTVHHESASAASPAPVLYAANTKSKKIIVRVPRVPEPAPVVYVYYGGASAPTAVSSQASLVAAAPVTATRTRFWWR